MRIIITTIILSAMVLCAAQSQAQETRLKYEARRCIDRSAAQNNTMRMEINTAKRCAESFADDIQAYIDNPKLGHIIELLDEGKAPQAFTEALKDTTLSKFEKYRLLARICVLRIDMASALGYYEKTMQCDEGNTFGHLIEFSEFCRHYELKNKAKDLGLNAITIANTPMEQYLGKINMVMVHLDLDESDKALRELNSIALIKMKSKPRDMEARINMIRGMIHSQKDEPKVALLYYNDALKQYQKTKDKHSEPIFLLSEISHIETANGNYARAAECMNKAINHCDIYNGIDREIARASIYLQWGMLLKSLGQPDQAREKLMLSLQTISRVVAKNRNYIADLAEIEAAQAALEIYMGDYKRAEALCEDAYNIYAQPHMQNSTQAMTGRASVLRTYGDLYLAWGQGKDKLALQKYENALDIYLRLSRTNDKNFDAERAITLNRIGSIYEQWNDFPYAISNYKMAARTISNTIESHPRYITTYGQILSNIGNLYRKNNQTDSSLKYMEMALNIFRSKAQLNDNEKAEYSKICNNLALQYKSLGKYEIAEPFYESAYQTRKYLMGKSDAYLGLWADILNNYGLYYIDIEDYDLALYYLNKALEIRQENSGSDNVPASLADNYENLGDLYIKMGDLEQAEQNYEHSRSVKECKAENFSYTDYARVMQKLASAYRSDNSLGQALLVISALDSDLSQQDSWENEQDKELFTEKIYVKHNKALILNELGLKKEARDMMEEVAGLFELVGSEYDIKYSPMAADAYCQAGNLSCDIDDYPSAEKFYNKALRISKDLYATGEMPAYTMVGALNNLGRMYYSISNMEEAKRCYQEGKNILENDSAYETDIETILTAAIINLNIVEYYIYEKNSGIDDDEYANCVKLLEETITTLKPFTDNSGVAHYHEQAQMLLKNILD